MNKSTAEIRQTFLDFFHSKGHQIVASGSLVPYNDSTLLFTNAGMNQFKDIFLGHDKRNYVRATTSQRCVRAGGKHNDLENVGYTARHHTFFEMLGNFSFGDYFKKEAISFAWELLTDENWFNLPKDRLWVTVYETDDEAYDIWETEAGVPRERIIRIGDNKGATYASDNFWQMGDTGPCGPCTEIFFDHGENVWGGPPGSPEEEGDRYIEIWNIVFMQYNRQVDGSLLALPKPSVDTGMGLERIAAVLQHVNSNYEIDLFAKLIESVAEIIGTSDLASQSLRVIADHIRSCAFLITDEVIPSNENRGYVLRRIIRRALRHGHMLGAENTFFYKLVAPLIKVMGSAGEDLKQQQVYIEKILRSEEEQFAKTLERGLALLDDELTKLQGDTLGGEIVFRLYDTFGFPIDLTADVCREQGLKIDIAGFEREMEQQRYRARNASVFGKKYSDIIHVDTVSEFKGYEQLSLDTTIVAIFVAGQQTEEIVAGEEAVIFVDKTPFYGESGGQVGDSGKFRKGDAQFLVKDTQKYGQAIGHIGSLLSGMLSVGDHPCAQVDEVRRKRIHLNHSATHLLHAALRQVLGEHVVQKGSLVNDKYLRFDFSHFVAMKPEEIRWVENIVNTQIRHNIPITARVMELKSAKEQNAMALFGEKYDEHVRVLSMGNFSIELCGGTHARRTGDLGLFAITSESGAAAGIRRIEAVIGESALAQMHSQRDQLQDITRLVKANNNNLIEKVRTVLEQMRLLEREIQQLKVQQATHESASLVNEAINLKGVKLLVNKLSNVEPKMLPAMVNELKNQLGTSIVVLATVANGKISLIAGVTKDLTTKVKAGELVNELAQQIDGKGGGRSDLAQGGGTNLKSLPAALVSIESWVAARL